MRYLLIAVLLAACGGDGVSPPTWGDAVEDISATYCQAMGECFSVGDVVDATEVAECTRHNVHHLCELRQTCDDVITAERQDAVDECVADIPEFECWALRWGILPDSCAGVFD